MYENIYACKKFIRRFCGSKKVKFSKLSVSNGTLCGHSMQTNARIPFNEQRRYSYSTPNTNFHCFPLLYLFFSFSADTSMPVGTRFIFFLLNSLHQHQTQHSANYI